MYMTGYDFRVAVWDGLRLEDRVEPVAAVPAHGMLGSAPAGAAAVGHREPDVWAIQRDEQYKLLPNGPS